MKKEKFTVKRAIWCHAAVNKPFSSRTPLSNFPAFLLAHSAWFPHYIVMSAQRLYHTVLPIEDLPAHIRQACLDDTDAIVSLSINNERSREKTVFRLNLQANGSLAATVESTSPALSEVKQLSSTTSPTPQQLTPLDTFRRSVQTTTVWEWTKKQVRLGTRAAQRVVHYQQHRAVQTRAAALPLSLSSRHLRPTASDAAHDSSILPIVSRTQYRQCRLSES